MSENYLDSENSDPYISVIITAFNRKEYLQEAVRSALEQSLSSSMYEIIVVKNFDHDMDVIHDGKRIRFYLINDYRLGYKYKKAIEMARGRIITFLDDDDLYYPERLENIYRIFSQDERLIYFHNAVKYINDHGELIESNFRKHDQEFSKSDTQLYISYKSSLRNLVYAKKIGADFNMSSIAIRKDIIIDKLDFLEKLVFTPDPFIFLCALISNGKIRIDSKALTYYRLKSKETVVQKGIDFKISNPNWPYNDRWLMLNMALTFGSKKAIDYAKFEINDFYLYSHTVKLCKNRNFYKTDLIKIFRSLPIKRSYINIYFLKYFYIYFLGLISKDLFCFPFQLRK